MTPAAIKQTRLYRTLAPKIRKRDREEFARMLALVPESATYGWRGFECGSLLAAFEWVYTPQGTVYWYPLYERLNRYDAGPDAQLPGDFCREY